MEKVFLWLGYTSKRSNEELQKNVMDEIEDKNRSASRIYFIKMRIIFPLKDNVKIAY